MHKVRGLLCFSFSQLFVIIMLTLVYVVSVLCVLQLLLIEFLSQHRRTHTHTHTHSIRDTLCEVLVYSVLPNLFRCIGRMPVQVQCHLHARKKVSA